ncbi:MAG: energy transducer TonB [Saprospiraceae bacterium]|nr:energy transducer TonB [Saprospiraceae bacterium]
MKYQKRLHWDRHRPEFLKLGFVMALAITLMAFNYTSQKPSIEPFESEPYEVDYLITPPPTVHKKKVVPPPPPPPKLTPNLEIEPVDEPVVTFEKEVDVKETEKVIVGEYATAPIIEAAPIVEVHIPDEPEDKTPLLLAERMPIYGDCDLDLDEATRRLCTQKNLMKHIYSNVKYPVEARDINVEGMVVVSFIVNKKGEIEDIDIVRDIGFGCGREVVASVNKLGKFLPGKQNGKPVRVIYRLPVKFKLH